MLAFVCITVCLEVGCRGEEGGGGVKGAHARRARPLQAIWGSDRLIDFLHSSSSAVVRLCLNQGAVDHKRGRNDISLLRLCEDSVWAA